MSDGKKITKIASSSEHIGHHIAEGADDLSGQVQRVKVGHPRHGGTSRKEEHFVSSDRAQVVPPSYLSEPGAELGAPKSGAERATESHELDKADHSTKPKFSRY